MRFICLGYVDESSWEGKSEVERQQLISKCFDFDDELRAGGHMLGGEALGSAHEAVTLRTKNGFVDITDGPYAETKEALGGILLLEARDLNHAIALMSKHPGVTIGPFEIRAADEQINAMAAERQAAAVRNIEQIEQPSSQMLREALEFSYKWIKPLADDLADAPMTSPTPTPGNHPVWIMGHLVYSSAGLLAMISGEASPYEHWKDHFAGGTQPRPDAASYPDYAEILQAYDATHQTALGLLETVIETGLNEPPPAVWDSVRDDPSFQTIGKLFLFISMHEMSHRGQLADTRRVLGRKPFA
ncbi:YciI family protein [Thalassoroseus pseudoceratinae]|uniref:YciI family protein n=1 Tax=Thalassoroseus pseudoceratinae TaxID=2713176 RepID=UPI00141EFE0F|nr:YciI family protein [Thalassoroseus pseudoceratinae]